MDVDGLTEQQIAGVPGLFQYLGERVRPDLLARGEIEETTPEWWHFRRPSAGMRAASLLTRFIAVAQTSSTYGFTFVDPTSILSHKSIGFLSDSSALFAVMQSLVHQVWSVLQGSTMKDDPVYTPEDCFVTFPFPKQLADNAELVRIGETYHGTRSDVMQRCQLGLTELYGRFHDRENTDAEIVDLRLMHDEMDRIVLGSYGWSDVSGNCEFIPEFNDGAEDEDSFPSGGLKFRYRWTDEVRDEVLGRLLELNRRRAEEEQLAGAAADSAKPKKRAQKKSVKVSLPAPTLFAAEEPSK